VAREKFRRWLQEAETAAAELVEVGDLLFRGGEPSDSALLRRYRLYRRVKAAVALPPGLERVAALQAAKIDRKALRVLAGGFVQVRHAAAAATAA
jgi:hypothetical protein